MAGGNNAHALEPLVLTPEVVERLEPIREQIRWWTGGKFMPTDQEMVDGINDLGAPHSALLRYRFGLGTGEEPLSEVNTAARINTKPFNMKNWTEKAILALHRYAGHKRLLAMSKEERLEQSVHLLGLPLNVRGHAFSYVYRVVGSYDVTIGMCLSRTPKEVLNERGIGPTKLQFVIDTLAAVGLALNDEE